MLLLRRIFFYLFLIIYLIAAPTLVLYALGYIVRPVPEPSLVKTGVISLNSLPSGAAIYLGKARFWRKTPAVIMQLLPGAYPIRLALKNYRPWNTHADVRAGEATVLDHVLLLPDTLKTETLIDEPFEKLIPVNGSDVILLAKGNRLNDLAAFDIKRNELRFLEFSPSALGEGKILELHTEPESPEVMFRLETAEGGRFLRADLDKKEIKVSDVSPLIFTDDLSSIKWEASEPNRIFYLNNGELNLARLDTQTVKPALIDGARSFGLREKKIYALINESVFRFNAEGGNAEPLLHNLELGRRLFGKDEPFTIHPFANGILLFLSEDGALISNIPPYLAVKEGVKNIEPSRKEDRFLIWTKQKAGILDFSKIKKKTAESFDASVALTWIFNEGAKIEQGFWVYEDSHILLRDENRVFLVEAFNLENPKSVFLTESKAGSSVFYSRSTGCLYYLERTGGTLKKLEIIPRETIAELLQMKEGSPLQPRSPLPREAEGEGRGEGAKTIRREQPSPYPSPFVRERGKMKERIPQK